MCPSSFKIFPTASGSRLLKMASIRNDNLLYADECHTASQNRKDFCKFCKMLCSTLGDIHS